MNLYIELFLESNGDFFDMAVCIRNLLGKDITFNNKSKKWILLNKEYSSNQIVEKIKNNIFNDIIKYITNKKNTMKKEEFEKNIDYFKNKLDFAFILTDKKAIEKILNILKKINNL